MNEKGWREEKYILRMAAAFMKEYFKRFYKSGINISDLEQVWGALNNVVNNCLTDEEIYRHILDSSYLYIIQMLLIMS